MTNDHIHNKHTTEHLWTNRNTTHRHKHNTGRITWSQWKQACGQRIDQPL